jgi:hypothetical protein
VFGSGLEVMYEPAIVDLECFGIKNRGNGSIIISIDEARLSGASLPCNPSLF